MAVTVFPAPSTGSASKSLTQTVITATGSWTAPVGVTKIECFLVAGGGGGGGAGGASHFGGGGGGGGVLNQILDVTPGTSYTVTIGAGGARGTNASVAGSNGATSSFGSLLTALGGGGGQSSGFTQPATTKKGTGGGAGNQAAGYFGGGGGGAAPVYLAWNYGSAALSQQEGAAAHGTLGYAITQGYQFPGNPGFNGYGAGGGGGSSSTVACIGGTNAGDGATTAVNATAATANFGGGGGGGAVSSATSTAGASGVCIISYWS